MNAKKTETKGAAVEALSELANMATQNKPSIQLETSPEPIQLEAPKRSALQPKSFTSLESLPKGSVMVAPDGDRLTINRMGGGYFEVWSEKERSTVRFDFDREHVKPTHDGFSVKGKKYYLELFGDESREQQMVESIERFIDLTAREQAAVKDFLSLAREKGEALLKVRGGLSAALWRDYLGVIATPKSTADVYMRVANGWDLIKPTAESIGEALKQIAAAKKTTSGDSGEKTEKPRLQLWQQALVDSAKEYKVRGSHSNLVLFLHKFGVTDDQIKAVLGPPKENAKE